MSSARHQRLKAIFERAAECTSGERAAYLASLRGEDATLRDEVESLLAWEAAHPNFLEPSLVRPTVTGAGARIGAWRVVREIGRGGMGTVYLVERADGEFEKRAALKLVATAGLGTQALQRRFRRERELLARLDHPHIARLLDGGATPEGAPWLVMEYVAGEPLVDACRRRGLSLVARLRLMRKVCEAVHCAHQSLVIHRDLKPGNILVGDDGEPRLLDFGIAALLDPSAAGASAEMTRTFAHAFTPAYASPEQFAARPVLTTASDVFSLGVLLYEVLADQHPFCAPNENVSAATFARRIDDADGPLRPSALGGPQSRALRGDLDAIVLKAMRHAPAERYDSAQALADDLDRTLRGMPVHARREDGWRYRAAKFARRHRAGVAAASVFAATVLAGVVALLRQARATREQRDLALETAALMAGELGEGLERMAGPAEVRLRLVARAAATLERIDRAGLGSREVERQRVEAHLRLSSAYRYLGDLPSALAQAQQGVERARRFGRGTPLDVQILVRALDVLGHVRAQDLKHEEALAVRQEGVDALEAAGAPRLADAWKILRPPYAHLAPELGETLVALARPAEAEKHFRRALAACEAYRAEEPAEMSYLQGAAAAAAGLARINGDRGDAPGRLREQTRCAEIWREIHERSPGVPEVVLNLAQETSNLAQAAYEAQQPEAALEHQRETVRVLRELFARDRSSALVRSMMVAHLERLGVGRRTAGDRDGARQAIGEALALADASGGAERLSMPALAALGSAEVELGSLTGDATPVRRGRDRLAALAARLPRERGLRLRLVLANCESAARAVPGTEPASDALEATITLLASENRTPAENAAMIACLVQRAQELRAAGRASEAREALASARCLRAELVAIRRWPSAPAAGLPAAPELDAALGE